MNNIVTVREGFQWAAAMALLFTDPWGHAHTFWPPGNVLIDGRLDSLPVNYIDYLWMSGANKIGAHFIFLGPASSWESYTAMIFLLTLLAQDYAQTQRGQMGERGGGVLYLSIWLVVNCNDFDKIIFLMVDMIFYNCQCFWFVFFALFCAFDFCLAFFPFCFVV